MTLPSSLRHALKPLAAATLAASLVAPAAAQEAIGIGVAPAASGWYFGFSELSRLVSADSPLEVSVRETGGSRENAIRLGRGEIDMGLIDAPGAYEAYTGTGRYENDPIEQMRMVLWVAPSTMHWAVRQDSGIETFEDLEGERFNPSSIGGGGEYITELVFNALGIAPDFQRMSMSDAADAVVDGRIVGFSYNGIPPIPAFTEVHSSRPLRVLSLSDEQVVTATEALPFLSATEIPEGTYRDMPAATTLGTYIGIAATSDLSEEAAYEFTRAYWENVEQLGETFAPAQGMSAEISVENTATPLHAGALRYYREIGIEVPEELVPPEAQ
ncbi:TAXI family TRAP transporter solute-binding subunit [Halomonas sp. MCCC 1A11036]|uniref:TAXI family TRAP transporter solute-binding subunit n=1 Tax=Billgrantia zhangzhouensis TaxID=2733481 RepID=A0ABS9AHT0_9GAMM|nr:TAXI family TRAP transporter solute-binding subunit [Halomonas zhangzhouensis]MCE8021305.1 TAXI family TRAP transporter solute-binding subunit [Halomonas zhangzhouensis]